MDNKIIVTEKAKKTIQINPEFLKLNGNLKKNTTLKRKQKPIQNQKVETNPSLVKKKLIEKIQAFKNKAVSGQENRVQENRVQENRVQENRVQENRVQENRDQEQKEQAKEREKFNNEFNKSLDFLQSLSNKRKENKVQQRNKVQKVQQPVQQQSVQQQSVQQQPVQQQSVQQQPVQQQSVQQKQPSIKNKTLKHGKIERTVHNEVINEILETELPPELSSIFRYPPQKNINFSIEDSISSESMQSESMQSEFMQSESMQSESMQSEFIHREPIQSQPIQSEPMQSEPIQSQPMQSDPILKEPAYSNLKNGSKPTFREWKNQTLKNHHVPKHKKLQIEEEHFNYSAPITSAPVTSATITSAPITSAPIKESTILEELKEFKSKVNINEPITLLGDQVKQSDQVNQSDQVKQSDLVKQSEQINQSDQVKQYKKITTRTLKYKLGKRGKKVGVLIKNAKTRKIIQKEYALLKQKQISDIKNYLRSKNLLKIGSDAPNDVLRQMYEQAILSGEVENKAGETLIHNFMHA